MSYRTNRSWIPYLDTCDQFEIFKIIISSHSSDPTTILFISTSAMDTSIVELQKKEGFSSQSYSYQILKNDFSEEHIQLALQLTQQYMSQAIKEKDICTNLKKNSRVNIVMVAAAGKWFVGKCLDVHWLIKPRVSFRFKLPRRTLFSTCWCFKVLEKLEI